MNLRSWNLNLEKKPELKLESSINNQQFVCREKKKKLELEAKTRENCGCSKPWELCYEAATRLVFIEKTRLNLLTSHLLVKVGFLDSNLLRTLGGQKEVRFGPTLARFKDLEVSYNFPRNSLLHKTHGVFVIPKIPLGEKQVVPNNEANKCSSLD